MQQLNVKFLNLPEPSPESRFVDKAVRAIALARIWASEARAVGLPDLLPPVAGSDLRALLLQRLCHVHRGAREAWPDRPLRGGNLAPRGERLRPEFAKGAAGGQVALDIEVVVEGGMGGKEPLRRAR